MNLAQADRYLLPKEVEQLTGFKQQTLANKRFRGEGIPYCKVGRSVRYKLSDVLAYMEDHRITPGGNGAQAGQDV